MRKFFGTFLLLGALVSCNSQSAQPVVVNDPYEGVDWATTLQLKAALHIHTCNSKIEHGEEEGTTVTPAEQVANYEKIGYDVAAITDHDYITYPWEVYGIHSDLIAIKGNELSKNDNICAYFCDWLDRPGEGPEVTVGFEESIQKASDAGAILYLAHPMRSGEIKDPKFSTDILRRYPQVYGIEVLNVGQFERNNSIELWDALLSELLPERQVWGTSSDDSHSIRMSGYGWTTMLTSERTAEAVGEALKQGTTLFSTTKIATGNTPIGDVPHITAIHHNKEQRTITISATDYEHIEWVSMGKVVATSESINYATCEGVEKYLRATLYGAGGTTFTQAWALNKKRK